MKNPLGGESKHHHPPCKCSHNRLCVLPGLPDSQARLFLDLIDLLSPHPGTREPGKCVCTSSQEAMSNHGTKSCTLTRLYYKTIRPSCTHPRKEDPSIPFYLPAPSFLRIPSPGNTLRWPSGRWGVRASLAGPDEDSVGMRETRATEET